MDKLSAYQFWERVDKEREKKRITLEQLAAAIGIKHQSIRDQRSKDLIPKSETLYKMSIALNVTMEYLLAGVTQYKYDARVRAIADWLSEDEGRISAMEKIIFGEKAGASSEAG